MSVPSWRRNESKVEFLNNFNSLRRDVISILMRDFGVKKKSYDIELTEDIYKLDPNDKELFEQLMIKYGMNSLSVDKYPSWLIDHWRNDVLTILSRISVEIQLGNSIYIDKSNDFEEDYQERKKHFSQAIGYCKALEDKLQEIIMSIKVSLGAYEQVSDKLQKEIRLLKGVRRADKKLINKFREEL